MSDAPLTPDASPAFPPIRELLPHTGSAVLLDRVLAHDARKTVCTVDPRAGASYRNADGSMPSYIGLEMMAQAIAAHGGLLAQNEPGGARRPGFFVGTRRITFAARAFAAGQTLTVTAEYQRSAYGLHAFDCTIDDASGGARMVSGVLTVYLLESFEELARDFSQDA